MAQPDINDIIIIAKQAGLILREGYEKHHDIKMKTRQDDLVTEMDKKSENFIMERINAMWPGHTIITEETGTHTGDTEHAWYIDPCDGRCLPSPSVTPVKANWSKASFMTRCGTNAFTRKKAKAPF